MVEHRNGLISKRESKEYHAISSKFFHLRRAMCEKEVCENLFISPKISSKFAHRISHTRVRTSSSLKKSSVLDLWIVFSQVLVVGMYPRSVAAFWTAKIMFFMIEHRNELISKRKSKEYHPISSKIFRLRWTMCEKSVRKRI